MKNSKLSRAFIINSIRNSVGCQMGIGFKSWLVPLKFILVSLSFWPVALPALSYNIALCHYSLKNYPQASKYAEEVIDHGAREHPGKAHLCANCHLLCQLLSVIISWSAHLFELDSSVGHSYCSDLFVLFDDLFDLRRCVPARAEYRVDDWGNRHPQRGQHTGPASDGPDWSL